MDQRVVLVIIVAVVVVAAIGVAFYWRNQQRARLRQRFGPEYQQTVAKLHSEKRAEAELEDREKRVKKIRFRDLTPEEQRRFSSSWREVQARFVDDPAAAATQAEALLQDLMTARGYPQTEFDASAADLSVNYPTLVQNYREAHAISTRHKRGEAGTEDLRRALVYYRALFDELLDTRKAA